MASADFKDKSIPGGVVHNPASPHSREMAKWEMGYNPYGPPGRPRESVGYQHYPAMFYKMKRRTTNGDFITEHYQLADNETEARHLESQGYRMGQTAAIAYVEGLEQAVAVAAAERNYQDRNASDKAKAEIAAAEAEAGAQHIGEIPEKPIRRRGPNKPKAE